MEHSFKSPLVVGYKGEIGSFILQGLLKTMPKASNIWCYDIGETEKERTERIIKSDVIFLCVPIQDTIKWLWKNALILEGKTIIEQCSLKSFIYEDVLVKKRDFTLLSMHILFRPSATPNLGDRSVGLIEQPTGLWSGWLIDKIRDITNSEVTWFDTYEEHDQAMAREQALVHRVLLALGNTIQGWGHETYIGGKVLELVERIKDGDPVLYKKIQSNKYLPKIMKEFQENLHEKI